MNFNKHSDLRGTHALFSPSQSSWLRYDEDKIRERIRNQYRTAIGTELHEYVAQQITLGHKMKNIRNVVDGIENYIFTKYRCADDTKTSSYGMTLLDQIGNLPRSVFNTAKMYVNDGIDFRMTVEQPLVYSEFCFGTADTIAFRNNLLRISDFKSGAHPADMEQVLTYAALFCLEYTIKPKDIRTELRIYQSSEIVLDEPEPDEIQDVMSAIVFVNRTTEKYKAKEGRTYE